MSVHRAVVRESRLRALRRRESACPDCRRSYDPNTTNWKCPHCGRKDHRRG